MKGNRVANHSTVYMEERLTPEPDNGFINTTRLRHIAVLYKVPILFGVGALLLFVTGMAVLFTNNAPPDEIVFSIGTDVAASTSAASLRIDIAGSVMTPGVYSFTDGQRIADALAASGGLSGQADREWVAKNINKAAKLIDGGKIYIPKIGEQKAISVKHEGEVQNNLLGSSVGKVNINTASQMELEALPGVGPVTAEKIIAGGPYQSIEELKTKKILGEKAYEKLKDLISVF